MLVVLLVVLMIIIVVFGVSSGMQSYATAEQAKATVEVARVAQVSAWGNVLTIISLLVIVVVILALIAVVVWFHYQRSVVAKKQRTGSQTPGMPVLTASHSIEMMVQLKLIQMLERMDAQSQNQLDVPREEPAEDPFPWLRS